MIMCVEDNPELVLDWDAIFEFPILGKGNWVNARLTLDKLYSFPSNGLRLVKTHHLRPI